MNSSKVIHVVSCHAAGEVGDVIVGGVAAPPGDSIWEQSRFIARDETLRNFMLNEPRGGVFRHVNLLVPPKNPLAQMGWIIMEPCDTPPMSGSNSICVATVLLETGIIPMTEPVTRMVLEPPGGLIEITADCKDGKAQRISVRNLPSFAAKLDAQLEVAGVGTLVVDTAYGGDSFVIVDARKLGFAIQADEARELAELGMKITAAATEQLGFLHPANVDWKHISFCQFAGPLSQENGVWTGSNAVAIRPGKIDRSPTGTGCSARMAEAHVGRRGPMRDARDRMLLHVVGWQVVVRRADMGLEECPGAARKPAQKNGLPTGQCSRLALQRTVDPPNEQRRQEPQHQHGSGYGQHRRTQQGQSDAADDGEYRADGHRARAMQQVLQAAGRSIDPDIGGRTPLQQPALGQQNAPQGARNGPHAVDRLVGQAGQRLRRLQQQVPHLAAEQRRGPRRLLGAPVLEGEAQPGRQAGAQWHQCDDREHIQGPPRRLRHQAPCDQQHQQ